MKNNFILKKIIFIAITAIFAGSMALYFSGCNNDDDNKESTLAGTYKMKKVTVTEDYKIDDQVIFPAGMDITMLASAGILSAAPCNDSTNAAVDLRSTKELFMVCTGESGELSAGTWDENSTLTKLDLFLSSPPFPLPLQLSVTNITYSDTDISGSINQLTLPGDLVQPFLPSGIQAPPAVILVVSVEFVKVE